MNTLFDTNTRRHLIARVMTLTVESPRQWGKMNVYQMVKHCSEVEKMYLGKIVFKQLFIGKVLGKIALRQNLKDASPFRRNSPTATEFKIPELEGDLDAEKRKWIELIEEYSETTIEGFVHPFFGWVTREQMGQLSYKHIDHHLRQFSA